MNLIIFGAQSVALGAYNAIHYLCPSKFIESFLVSELGMNPSSLAGIPVKELHSFATNLSQIDKENIEVLIATPESVMPEIEKELDFYGLHCHVRLDSKRWADLMERYYLCIKKFTPLSSLPIGYHESNIHVFMARFYKDVILKQRYQIPDWIQPIQVGAALSTERFTDILDCDGENISKKNVNYSELSGLYWIWKNKILSDQDKNKNLYYGLVHYRRILILSNDDLLRLADNDVDVVLPYPMPYEPNIEVHHKRYLNDGDWRALIKALEELRPDYKDDFEQIMQQKYLYNYNIIIARKRVISNYCAWLFPILERIEQISNPKGNERADRYIGYMGETLETLYFMSNRDKLNIVHVGCKYLI